MFIFHTAERAGGATGGSASGRVYQRYKQLKTRYTMDYDDLTRSGKVVMVEFYATWCPHCQRMMPIVEQIRELMEGEVKIYQLDIDKNQEVADDEGVESAPTFMLYRDNELVWKQAGEVEGEVLLGRIQEALR